MPKFDGRVAPNLVTKFPSTNAKGDVFACAVHRIEPSFVVEEQVEQYFFANHYTTKPARRNLEQAFLGVILVTLGVSVFVLVESDTLKDNRRKRRSRRLHARA